MPQKDRSRLLETTAGLCLGVLLASGSCWAAGTAARQKVKEHVGRLLWRERSWHVALLRSSHGYHVLSSTNLKGQPAAQIKPVEIASGGFQSWRYKIEADPSLLPSWKTWLHSKVARKSARLPADDWSYAAMDWGRAFERAYEITRYLLGRPPVPLDATLILVPLDRAYHQRFDQQEDNAVPLTLGLAYLPGTISTRSDQYARAMVIGVGAEAIVAEYERVLNEAGAIGSKGENPAARLANQEGQNTCWFESASLAEFAGTRFITGLNWKQQSSADQLAHHPPADVKLSDARYWGLLREAESISGYLEVRGLKNRKFSPRDTTAMNAVLSVCRAMTQQPHDLTKGPYPASQVTYVPFFPKKLR